MKDYKEILKEDAFKCIDEERKRIIFQMAEQIKGKNGVEILTLFMSNNEKLNAGKPINEIERKAMLEVLKSNLEPEDLEKLNQVLKIAGVNL